MIIESIIYDKNLFKFDEERDKNKKKMKNLLLLISC